MFGIANNSMHLQIDNVDVSSMIQSLIENMHASLFQNDSLWVDPITVMYQGKVSACG
jgi:hypothetical protein